MFCSKCGNKSPSGARFCQKCGAKKENNNGTAHLLNHPSSLAELEGGAGSLAAHDVSGIAEPDAIAGRGHEALAAKHSDAKPSGYGKRAHMPAPTPSADMDYTFYPGQTAESDIDEPVKNSASDSDPMEYLIEPTFPKPANKRLRAITDTNPARFNGKPSHSSQPVQSLPTVQPTPPVTPRLPEPESYAADVTEFSGYQILPAAYTPERQDARYDYYDRVPVQHVEIVNPEPPAPVQIPPQPMPLNVPPPEPEPIHIPQPQAVPVYAQPLPSPQQQLAYIPPVPSQQPVHISPAPSQQPVHIPPVSSQQPAHIASVPLPQPVNISPQQQPVHTPPPQPQQPVRVPPQPAYTQQLAEHDTQHEMRQMYDGYEESDGMETHAPEKKRLRPVIVGVVVIIIAIAAAAFFFSRMGNINPNRLVGTWTQSPPLGTWIPRIEFRDDGTGQFYHFNTSHNASRHETEFTWSIESGDMMINSLWDERAQIVLERGARPPRFRYRLESRSDWNSFMLVVEVEE